MTSGKSACYTRQKMLLPPRPRPPLYANERTNERTDERKRATISLCVPRCDGEGKGRKGFSIRTFVPSFLRSLYGFPRIVVMQRDEEE